METRPPALRAAARSTQRDLVRNALRMRPDRIIIGEVRGGEAFDMLQAMNTGHDGSMSTIHANTTRDALTRIENMVQMGNMGLPARSIRAADRRRHRPDRAGGAATRRRPPRHPGDRGLRYGRRDVILNDVFSYQVDGETISGGLVGHYRVNRARPSFHQRLTYFGLDRAWTAALEEAETMSPLPALLIGALFVSAGVAVGIIGHHAGAETTAAVQRAAATGCCPVHEGQSTGRDGTRYRWPVRAGDAARRNGRASVRLRPGPCRTLLMRWWIVLGAALIPARAIAEMAGIFAGTWSLLVVPVVWVMFCRFAFHWSEQRRRNVLYSQFPDALAMIVRAVKVGIPLGEGIHTVAREALPPTGPEFALLYDRHRDRGDARGRVARDGRTYRHRRVPLLATALALQGRTGWRA